MRCQQPKGLKWDATNNIQTEDRQLTRALTLACRITAEQSMMVSKLWYTWHDGKGGKLTMNPRVMHITHRKWLCKFLSKTLSSAAVLPTMAQELLATLTPACLLSYVDCFFVSSWYNDKRSLLSATTQEQMTSITKRITSYRGLLCLWKRVHDLKGWRTPPLCLLSQGTEPQIKNTVKQK